MTEAQRSARQERRRLRRLAAKGGYTYIPGYVPGEEELDDPRFAAPVIEVPHYANQAETDEYLDAAEADHYRQLGIH